MAPEDARSGGRSRYDDDDDELPIRKKGGGNNTVLVILAVGGISLVLLACILAGTIAAILAVSADATAAKIPGSWKARFDLPGLAIVSTYTFKKNGDFREEAFTPEGQFLHIADGRWQIRDGEIQIDWDNGSFERAVPTWIDDNTMEYRIVDHSDVVQIGLVTTFRRQ